MAFLIRLATPFGFDIFCVRHKFLIYNLVGRNLKVRYRQSVLGILWTVLLPLLNAAILFVVFRYVIKIKIPHYLVYLISGTLPWAFFLTSLSDGMESLRGHASLISKIPLPLQIFPLVTVITGFVNLLFAIPIVILAMLLTGLVPTWAMLCLPFILVLFFATAYGFALITSFTVVYVEDLRHLVSVVMQIWFYATPIVYEAKMIPPELGWIVYANPVCALFISLRTVLIEGVVPPLALLATSTAWAVAVVSIGGALYRTHGRRIPENL